jgi:hypothetical protein
MPKRGIVRVVPKPCRNAASEQRRVQVGPAAVHDVDNTQEHKITSRIVPERTRQVNTSIRCLQVTRSVLPLSAMSHAAINTQKAQVTSRARRSNVVSHLQDCRQRRKLRQTHLHSQSRPSPPSTPGPTRLWQRLK